MILFLPWSSNRCRYDAFELPFTNPRTKEPQAFALGEAKDNALVGLAVAANSKGSRRSLAVPGITMRRERCEGMLLSL